MEYILHKNIFVIFSEETLMSYVVQNLAWKIEGLNPTTKFVLIALCDYANKQKFTAWPSHKSIAMRTCMSVSSVQRAIKSLCELGLLSYRNRYDAKGNKRSNLYQINLSRLLELTSPPDNVVRMTPPSGRADQGGTVTMTDKPLTRTFIEPSTDDEYSSKVIGTNYGDRPITKKRMQEICQELGSHLD